LQSATALEEEAMAKLIWSVFMSVDGYYAGSNGEFVPPAWSEDMNNRSLEITGATGHLIYGRINYEFNRDFWIQAETDPNSDAAGISYAADMNRAPKTMFSRSFKGDPGWNGTVADDADMIEVVARLKAETAKGDVFLMGSGNLAQSFIQRDLIDEYQLLLIPHLQGDGLRVFEKAPADLGLTLVEARPFDVGAVLLRYARNRAQAASPTASVSAMQNDEI
jgi:dihydrofolate reductase